MPLQTLIALTLTLTLALALAPGAAHAQERAPAPAFVVQGVAVFDGETLRPDTDVVVQGGRITAVGTPGTRLPLPAGATVVPGRGRTLLPGLIDAHTHAWGDALKDALRLGVTTELEMFGDPTRLPQLRARRASLAPTDEADLWSAGVLATAPRGHGTQFGLHIPTLVRPEEAGDFVRRRVAEGSDYLKIVLETGSFIGRELPSLTGDTVATLAAAARGAGSMAVAHVATEADALLAMRGGVQGLVHVWMDREAGAPLLELLRERKGFVVPALSVVASVAGATHARTLADDERLRPVLSADQRTSLQTTFPLAWKRAPLLQQALANVAQLQQAGVMLLAGTDAGNPGTAHGASMHGELALLVQAGLTPLQALVAATSAPARAFALGDRGRIAPGLRADLLLVEGDPTRDITATRAIAAVWKNGAPVQRVPTAAPAGGDAAEAAPAATLVADFEDGNVAVRYGQPWAVTTDAMAGGKSTATQAWLAGGAAGSKGALRVQGEVAPGLPYAWAGTLFMPGRQPFAAVDHGSRSTLVFQVRGAPGERSAMIFSGPPTQRMPAVVTYTVTPDWQEVRIPLDRFRGADLKQLRGLAFTAGPAPGPFSFDIDDVRIE